MKRAMITGITGQDGSYLAELLLAKGYEVHGIIRRASTFNTVRIAHLYQDPHINGVRLFLHYGDISDATSLINLLYRIQPDEIYHLGTQSHLRVSSDILDYTGDLTGLGPVTSLEANRETFVTRKIPRAVAQIKAGMQDKLYLGNLEAKRDWGYAKEYVEAMWLMLQQDSPDDYVIATGETHSVLEFLEEAFSCVGLDWKN